MPSTAGNTSPSRPARTSSRSDWATRGVRTPEGVEAFLPGSGSAGRQAALRSQSAAGQRGPLMTPDQAVAHSRDRPALHLRASCVTDAETACSTVAPQERPAADRCASASASSSLPQPQVEAQLAPRPRICRWIRDASLPVPAVRPDKPTDRPERDRHRRERRQVVVAKQAGFTLVDVFDGDKEEPCASANGAVWTLEEALASPLGHPNCVRVSPHARRSAGGRLAPAAKPSKGITAASARGLLEKSPQSRGARVADNPLHVPGAPPAEGQPVPSASVAKVARPPGRPGHRLA